MEQRLLDLVNLFENQKYQTKRKSNKVKHLKKERDNLKMEILKIKQMYSEKCDKYREDKHKLQRKLKKRDDKLLKLEEKLVYYERNYRNQISPRSNNGQFRENTDYLYHYHNNVAIEYMGRQSFE